MDLPTKDKKGNSFLTPSEISTFLRSKEDYYKQYILKAPFVSNDYIEFGQKVGESLEHNVFNNFSDNETKILKKVVRLDLFERKTFLRYEGFYIPGRIDTCSSSLLEIIDYKTGGVGKDKQYIDTKYYQIPIYALSIKQETGITPKKASVEFITRGGNAFRGENLYVKNIDPKSIEIDISSERLKKTYWEVLRVAENINEFYKENK